MSIFLKRHNYASAIWHKPHATKRKRFMAMTRKNGKMVRKPFPTRRAANDWIDQVYAAENSGPVRVAP